MLFGVILLSLTSLAVARIPPPTFIYLRCNVTFPSFPSESKCLSVSFSGFIVSQNVRDDAVLGWPFLCFPLLTAQLLQGVDSGEQTMPVLWISHIQLHQVMLPQPHQVIYCLVTVQLQRRGILLVKQVEKTPFRSWRGTLLCLCEMIVDTLKWFHNTNKNKIPPNWGALTLPGQLISVSLCGIVLPGMFQDSPLLAHPHKWTWNFLFCCSACLSIFPWGAWQWCQSHLPPEWKFSLITFIWLRPCTKNIHLIPREEMLCFSYTFHLRSLERYTLTTIQFTSSKYSQHKILSIKRSFPNTLPLYWGQNPHSSYPAKTYSKVYP